MSNAMEMIRHRTSIRSFREDGFWKDDREKVLQYACQAANPYDIPVTWQILDDKTYGLSSPVLTGAHVYLAGKMKRVPHAEEAFGFAFEDIVLFADANGIGTTIIAGTMNREAFEKAMEVARDEVLPCVTPLGYPAKKRSLKELAMRKAIGADKRIAVAEFAFDKSFGNKASDNSFGSLTEILEMVRWAPSAVNKQPWRIVVDDNRVHFYKKNSKGFIDSDTGWDIQKIDIGIAMKHFELGAKEQGLHPELSLEDPHLEAPEDTEYIASFTI